MDGSKNEIAVLAERVSKGEGKAVMEFRRKLVPQLVRLIRREIKVGDGTSAFARRVHAEMSRFCLGAGSDSADCEEGVIGQVAQSLCDTLIDNLQMHPRHGRHLIETVFG